MTASGSAKRRPILADPYVGPAWPRQVLADVLAGAAADMEELPGRGLWQMQVDGVVQASATLQVALVARMCGCSWRGIARVLNAHGLRRLVNVQTPHTEHGWEDWTHETVSAAVLRVPREPGTGHVLGWFAAQFCEGDMLQASWMISAMDGGGQTTVRAFVDARREGHGLQRAAEIARAAAAAPAVGAGQDPGRVPREHGTELKAERVALVRRTWGADAAEVARACWYWLFGPGARGQLGNLRVLTDRFREVAAGALEASGLAALDDAVRERGDQLEAAERWARLEAARVHGIAKKETD